MNMRCTMRRILLILVVVVLLSGTGHAQIAVHDSSVTIRNAITAALKEYLLEVQMAQHSQIRRMAQRLSFFTDLGKYSAPEAPRWRRHPGEDGEGEMLSSSLQSALDFGDAEGASYTALVHSVMADPALAALPAEARGDRSAAACDD